MIEKREFLYRLDIVVFIKMLPHNFLDKLVETQRGNMTINKKRRKQSK